MDVYGYVLRDILGFQKRVRYVVINENCFVKIIRWLLKNLWRTQCHFN
jgi:hypothetical protein